MATVLPNTPPGHFPLATARIFRLLRRLPDHFVVRQRLAAHDLHGPDFWVQRGDGCSLLLKVVAAPPAALRTARQTTLFGQPAIPGAQEEAALTAFVAGLGLPAGVELPALALFPLVARSDLELALDPPPPGIGRGAQEDLAAESFAAWIEDRLGSPLTPTLTATLRRAFNPEVVTPAALTVRRPIERARDAGLTDFLLSYNQEWVLKHDLDLSPEAEAAADELRLQLVNGVAGSGKSLLLLHRARLLREFFPRKRLLVLTHNRPLIRDLERRYMVLSAGDNGVEWRTFFSWCMAYWPTDLPKPRIISQRDREQVIHQICEQYLADTSVTPTLLAAEIDWLKDRLITSRRAYLAADRAGRGFALRESLRDRVYTAIHAYQEELATRKRLDFGDIPRRIWSALADPDAVFPRYDVVLIDEAQFFAPIWFAIVKRLLAPQYGQLFMVADPSQGFLKRGQSWLASGLNVRGQSQQLQRCYRTTGAILNFATRFYQLRLPDDDEALMTANLQQTPDGEPPVVIALTSEQDETARVVNEIKALVAAGVPREHILVIHADWRGAYRMLDRLRAEFGAAQAAHPRGAAVVDRIRVCQLDAVTGLESPIVFVMGTHKLIEAVDSLRIDAAERAERNRDTTRRLYMAFTRAGQRLVLTYVGEPPPALRPAA